MHVLRVSHSATVAQWRGRERALTDRGLDVSLLTARSWHAGGAEVTLTREPGERVVGVRTWGRHPALFVYDPRPLWRAFGEPWDVIDIHEEPFALATAEILAIRALRRVRTPIVLYTAQNIEKRYPIPFRWLERWALRSASGISACNSDAAAIVVRKGFAGRPRVIPLGVDLAQFGAREISATDPSEIVVGYVGRLVTEKGLDVLLRAIAGEPHLRARIAGAGPLAGELPRHAAELGIAERVDLVGPISPDDIPDFYRSVDVVAIPSIPTPSWTEQFGRVAVEAMACGIPVVSSDAGALPDIVGGAGIVVAHSDPHALGRALVEAAGPSAERLREAGFDRARSCSWPRVAAAYAELYRSVAPVPADPSRGVEVIVVAYGKADLLRAALEPLSGLAVTVVDNSSLAEVAQLCSELGVRYLDAGANRGFAGGVNIALRDRLTPTADVLLLNPDARIDAGAIAQLQRSLLSDPRLASVGPAQADDAGRSARVMWPFPSPVNAWLEAVGLGRFQFGAQFVIGSVLLLRAEALDAVGALDERFFLYAEETDWAYRAHKMGWRHQVVSEVRAMHLGGATSTDPRRREAHFFASQERFYRKHFGVAGWQVTRAACWLGATVRAIALNGERGVTARRRAAIYRLGPVRIETRLRETAA